MMRQPFGVAFLMMKNILLCSIMEQILCSTKGRVTMGKYTEQGKQFDIFSTEFPYKVMLLYGDRLERNNGESTLFEQITYYCRAHGETYRIRNSVDKFFCDKYILDEADLDDMEDVIGVGLDVEITVDDLDEMFGDWENFCKKLKPVNTDTIFELLESVPELQAPMPDELDIVMEDVFVSSKKYDDLKKDLDKLYKKNPEDVKNALGALLRNLELDGHSAYEDSVKLGEYYKKIVRCGEVWFTEFTRGVGHEIQGNRPALVISSNNRNSKLGTVMCIAIEGYPVDPHHKHTQIEIDKNKDVTYTGTGILTEPLSRVELTSVFTLDRARLKTKVGMLKPEKLDEVKVQFKKYYQLPNVAPEPIELDFGFEEDNEAK